MMGFTIPLMALGGVEAAVAFTLMFPFPFCRPGIFVCRLTNSQLGRTVCYTTSVILAVLLIAPIYDLVALHKYKGTTGESVSSSERRTELENELWLKHRETEATSQLSAILTASVLATLWVTRRLGLALGELDKLTDGKAHITESQKMGKFN